jgi:hypothetical protein
VSLGSAPDLPEQRRCALYRHYDVYDTLLYIGISETPVDRTYNHARSSQWVHYADRAEAQWFGTRALAEDAERYAIQDELPVFNRQHAVGDVDQRIADYLRGREVAELRETLEAYEKGVQRFIERVSPVVREQVEERVRRNYECAGEVVDRLFPVHVLDVLGGALHSYFEDAMDRADAERLSVQLKALNERIEARLRATTDEPF